MVLAFEREDGPLGDEGPITFAQLHRIFFDDLCRFLYRRVGDRELAEDIAQETFLRAYRARASYDPMRPVWPWLATIAKNLAINSHRNADRQRRSYQRAEFQDAEDQPDGHFDGDPEAVIANVQRRKAIAECLARLNPRQRRILSLRCINELSYEEIAAQEDLSLDALKSVLKRARQSFRANYLRIADETEVPIVAWGPAFRDWLVRLRQRLSSLAAELRPLSAGARSVGEALAVAGMSSVVLLSTPDVATHLPEPQPAGVGGSASSSTVDLADATSPGGDRDPSPSREDASVGRRSAPVRIGTAVDREPDRATIRINRETDVPARADDRGAQTGLELPCEDAIVMSTCDGLPRLGDR